MTPESDSARARYGWESDFPTFSEAEPRVVRISLQEFLTTPATRRSAPGTTPSPRSRSKSARSSRSTSSLEQYTAILEYELPLESRRPDVVLLVNGAVVVLELKGKTEPEQADLDQAAAYARDLRCYHRHCADREVHAVLVPTRAHGYAGVRDGVHIAGPDALHELIQKLQRSWEDGPLTADQFLAKDAYCPLPTLVQAARELFLDGKIRPIHRARAETQPAIDAISAIAHEAARTHTRHLVLVAGVPGSGKTLVGLSAVHNPSLDDLRVERAGGKPPAPAIFLSGNGPLVEVLQYELRGAGGGGKTFVRGVKDYMKQYLGDKGAIPPQHVIVYDEAQRAWDLEQVINKHPGIRSTSRSRKPSSSSASASPNGACSSDSSAPVRRSTSARRPASVSGARRSSEPARPSSGRFTPRSGCWTSSSRARSYRRARRPAKRLDLTVELRFHFAADLDEWVDGLLTDGDEAYGRELAERLEAAGYHLRMTRDLETAKSYFHKRYAEAPAARYGLVASSRDKVLAEWGIPNDYQSTKVMRLGPWYGDGDESHRSCRHLRECVTEFGAQGLELDGVLLAWGTDLLWTGDAWSNARAKNHARGTHVRDPFQLRVNAYRVLLTRGRDGAVIFVPPLAELDATAARLQGHGVKVLG